MNSRRSFTKKYYHKLKINYQHIKNNKKSILAYFGIKNFISYNKKNNRIPFRR